MQIEVISFWTQKDGNFRREFEDAFTFSLGEGKVLAAIADGASDTSYSRKWSKILVQKFKQNPESWLDPEMFKGSFMKAQKAWIENIDFSKFDYFVEKKIREGACSTMLGFKLYGSKTEADNSLTWKAIGVGDSCLFHIRDGKFLINFPIKQSDQFTHCLPLLCSVKDSLFKEPDVNFLDKAEPCKQRDIFLLCTDALAKYILAEYETKRDSWRELIALETYKDWATFIQRRRQEGKLDNDDTTLVVLHLK